MHGCEFGERSPADGPFRRVLLSAIQRLRGASARVLRFANSRMLCRFLVPAITVGIAACAGVQPPQAPLEISASGVAAQYELGPGDQVRINVYNQPDLSGEYAVGGAGLIALPLLGPVEGSGKTPRELEQLIGDGLIERELLVNPSVAVQVTQFRPYYILGEVGEPGAYAFSMGLTVRKAVAAARGFTYRANTRRVYIQRSGDAEEHLYELTPGTAVLPGDTIRIPERIF